jgi:hypothetical protein
MYIQLIFNYIRLHAFFIILSIVYNSIITFHTFNCTNHYFNIEIIYFTLHMALIL